MQIEEEMLAEMRERADIESTFGLGSDAPVPKDCHLIIRNGEIAGGLRNFRFNQSVVEMLRNVESMTASERASGEEAFDMVVPAMKVNGFQFTFYPAPGHFHGVLVLVECYVHIDL